MKTVVQYRRAVRDPRSALVGFVVVEALAAVLWVWLGRRQWFSTDEWDFLAARDGGDVSDLLRPHNEHWSTVPILAFRLLYHLFGLHSYVPYLLVVVALHLGAVALLRVIMRRSGVGPWLATAASSSMALFGSGSFNITFAFQIGFCGSLIFGLTHLLLADHDGPLNGRDVLGAAAGLLAVMCSGVGVVMVGVAGLACLIRRGPVAALVHTVPAGAAFVLWVATSGRDRYGSRASLSEVLRFAVTNVRATFAAVGDLPGVGVALAVVLVVGCGVLAATVPRTDLRRTVGGPAALLVGAGAFALTTGIGRGAENVDATLGAGASRYLHITAMLVLPALAMAANALVRRWRYLRLPLLLLLVAGIPGNVAGVRDLDKVDPFETDYRLGMLTAARLPIASALPRSTPVEPVFAPLVTFGWLRDTAASGRLPSPHPKPTSDGIAALTLNLALRDFAPTPRTECVPVGRAPLALEMGRILLFEGPVDVMILPSALSPAGRVHLEFAAEPVLRQVTVDGLVLRVEKGNVRQC